MGKPKTFIVETGRYADGEFPIKRGEICPSTHGAAGYCLGDYWTEDGKIVCCLCGAILNPIRETLHYFLRLSSRVY